MRTAPSIFVVIPCYNNSGTVAHVVRDAAKSGLEIIVVDDGSTEPLPSLPEGTILERSPGNQGKGAAIMAGVATARKRGGTHVITMDADAQHLGSDLPVFVSAITEDPEAMIVGVRDLSGENVPLSSRYGREFSNFWVTIHIGAWCRDALSGYRAYPVEKLITAGPRSRGFASEAETFILWDRAGWRIKWVAVAAVYLPEDERVSHFNKWKDNARLVALHARYVPGSLLRYLTGARYKRRGWVVAPRGSAFLYRLMGWLIRWMGRKNAYRFAWFVFPYFLFFAPAAVKNIKRFVAKARPGKEPAALPTFRAFAIALVDRIARVNGVADDLTCRVEGEEKYPAVINEEGKVIFLSAHFGSWDVGTRIAVENRLQLAVVMNRDMADFAQEYFEQSGGGLIQVLAVDEERGSIAIVEALRKNICVAMHGDRIMDGQRPVMTSFLGCAIAIPSGPYQIAYVTETSILPTFCVKEGEDEVLIAVGEPIRPVKVARADRAKEIERMAQSYSAQLEVVALRYPEQWFNFYDFFQEG